MIHLIEKFDTEVNENNGSIFVNYKHDTLTGYCEYKIVDVNNSPKLFGTVKRFKQKAWLLINTDMGDVIEFIHLNSPLSSENLQEVNKLIRDHSLLQVQNHTILK